MKVLFIILFSALATALGLGTIRLWGQNQAFQEYKHPFFQEAQALDAVRARSADDVEAVNKVNSQLISWIEVRFTKDFQFIVTPTPIEKSFRYSTAELTQQGYTFHMLESLISRAPKGRFILHFTDNATDIHTHILNFIRKNSLMDRVLITSDVDAVIQTVRDDSPNWVYGTSQAELLRLLSYEGLWILPAANIRADVLVAPLQVKGRPIFTLDGILEMKRRHKKTILGPIFTLQDFSTASSFPVSGIIFDSLQLYQETRPSSSN